jgi:hypothetical protein
MHIPTPTIRRTQVRLVLFIDPLYRRSKLHYLVFQPPECLKIDLANVVKFLKQPLRRVMTVLLEPFQMY